MKKLLLFVIACTLGLFGTVSAQETITIGEGGTTNAALPVDFYNGYGICQQIFLADEINHADGGTITSMAIKFFGETMSGLAENPTDATFERNVDIYINSTELTELTGGVDLSAGQTPYFQGTVTYVPEEWTEFVFDTPYQYDGGNIIITMHDYTGGDYQNYYHFYADFAEKRAVYANITSKLTNEYLENSLSQVLWNSPSRNNIQLTFAAAGEGGEEPEPTPEPEPTIPSHPASMTATANGQNSITLTWEAVEGATSYNIYSTAAGNVPAVTATEYTYEGLTAGTQYCFEVTAENAAGESYDAASDCATTEAAPVEPETQDPNVVTIGDASANNTTANANYPFANVYTYSHSQQIYTPATISAFCDQIPEGDITKIKYYIAETSQTYFSGVKVYMRNSLTSSFSSKTAWDKDFTAADLVFEGAVDVVDNAIEFVLQKSFTYDPTMNLIIYVDVDTKNGTSQTKFKTYSAAAKCALYYKNQNTNGGLDTDHLWGASSSSAANTINVVSLTFAGEGGGEEPEPTPVAPAAPVVTVETVTETTVTLTWEAVDGATSYNIYTPNNYAGSNVLGLEATTYTFEGLTAGTEYCFEVSSVNTVDESEATKACATTTAAPVEPTPEPDPTPAYVEIGTGDNETMVVPVNMNSGYSYSQQLYTAQEIGIASGDITGVSFKVNSGFSGTRTVDVYMKHTEKTAFVDSYTYEKMTEDNKVFSGNFVVEANEGQWAEIVFDTPFAYEGGNFVISINDYTASNPGETYFCTDYLEEYKTLYYYPLWNGSKLDPSNMSGKGYGSYHRNIVRFALASGEGGENPTPEPEPTVPAAPQNLVATANGQTSLILTWDAVEDATMYNIYSGTTVIAEVTEPTYTVNNLQAGQNFCFFVSAVNAVGESDLVEVCGTTEAAPVAPAIPTNVVATANGQNSIIVTWDAVEGAAKYVVYKDGNEWTSTSEYNPTTTVTIDGLEAGKQYCFAVKAVANGLESELSETDCATTESLLPELPENQVLVGEATTNYLTPFVTAVGNAWVEMIYKADEIGKAGKIAEIAYSWNSGDEVTADVNIYLAEVTKSEFANPNTTPESELKLVYSGTGITLCDSAWETFVLDTQFEYSGENNLLVVVATSNPSSTAYNYWNCYTGDANTVLIKDIPLTNKKPVMLLTLAEEVVPEPVAPAAPEVVNVESVTESTITLTWNTVEGAEYYNIYSVDFDTTYVTFVVDSSYTATGLDAYTEYCFAVAAVSEDSLVSAKTTQCAKTSDLTIVAPVVEAEATSDSTITLTWNEVENALSYNIYSADTLVANVTGTSYTVLGLEADTEYSFIVAAVRNEQEVKSEEKTAKTLAAAPVVPEPVVPAAPVVAVDTVTETTVTLTWAAVEGATSYNVYSADTLVANVKETTYTVEGLTAETEYTFVVKAVNEVGESEASNVATAKTLAAAPVGPTVPAAPVVTVTVSYDTIQVRWEPVAGATSYRLYYKGELQDEFEDPALDIQVPTQGKYCFNITAVNEIGESEPAEACADVVAPEGMVAPAAPVLNATLDGDVAVLSWSAVEFGTYYNVYLLTPQSEMPYQYLGTSKDTSVKLQLEAKGEYCFFVTAQNLVGESKESNTACVNYGEGVEENVATFNIYPNPVSDKLVIETEATIEAVTIYSVTGVMVYAEVDFNNNMIDVTDFASGVYFIKVRTENGEAVQRFIKK